MPPGNDRPDLLLQSLTYLERATLMPALETAVDRAGGWFLERHSLSVSAVEVSLEVQTQALPELYGALLAVGLELTRDSHRALAERCNCSLHLPPRQGPTFLMMRLEIHFLVGAAALYRPDAPAADRAVHGLTAAREALAR